MKKYIEERVREVAAHILLTKSTIRKTAKVFGVSKSTIEKDVSERLLEIDPELHTHIQDIKDFNMIEKHIRGGESTARKYRMM